MPKLIVQLKQKTIQELDLGGDRVVIGRGEDNAVRLDDILISREHAEIREDGGRYYLSDLGSANGTYVGTRRITRDHELRDGDVVRISPYTISFRTEAHERPTEVGMVGGTRAGEKATEVFTFSGTPRLLVRSGAEVGKTYDLASNPLIGRDAECDIVLNEATVSRKHARIQYIENKLTVVDVGSRSGTRVNGKLIDKPTPLKDGDRLQLGEAALEVEWKGGPAKVEAEKATVPFFRPELEPAKKEAQWWKWVVGIAAGLIVLVGAYLLFTRLQPGGGAAAPKPAGAAVSAFLEKSAQAMKGGDYEAAVLYADDAWKADSASAEVQAQRIATRKAIAYDLERRGQNAKAAAHWDVVRAMNPMDEDVLRRQPGKPVKPAPETPSEPQPRPPAQPKPTPYELALAAYHDGLTAESRAAVDRLVASAPNDVKALELKGWIGLEDEATYVLDVRKDTAAAIEKFGELVRQDPGNPRVQARLRALTAKPTTWDSQKAKDLFKEAEGYYLRWKDYGEEEFRDKAKPLYQQIVQMGPPPEDAAKEDKDIYGTAKQR